MNNNIFSDPDLFNKSLNGCPLCGSKSIRLHYIIEKYTHPFKTDICGDCGFIFMNPRFNSKVIRDLYSEDYYRGNAEYSYYDEREAEIYSAYVWNKRIKKIRSFVKSGNFLDIGCAFGGLLKTASEHFTPYGIDLSEYSGKCAKEIFGSSIHIGSLDDHPFNPDFFSVITMIELLEHLDNPAAAITECCRILKQDGLLVIQTANMEGMQARLQKENYAYFMPGHLSYFSKANLSALLIEAGFRKVKVFHPVDFGLLPKLLKSRYIFKSNKDYLKWFRISLYHYLSKIRFRNFSATSSMVIYAIK